MASGGGWKRPWENTRNHCQLLPTFAAIDHPSQTTSGRVGGTIDHEQHRFPSLSQVIDLAQPAPIDCGPLRGKISEPLIQLISPSVRGYRIKRQRIGKTGADRSGTEDTRLAENHVPPTNQHYQLPSPTHLLGHKEQTQSILPRETADGCCASPEACTPCVRKRALVRAIVSDLWELDAGVQSLRSATEAAPLKPSVDARDGPLLDALEWILETIRENTLQVREILSGASRSERRLSNRPSIEQSLHLGSGAAEGPAPKSMPSGKPADGGYMLDPSRGDRRSCHVSTASSADRPHGRHFGNVPDNVYSPAYSTSVGHPYSALSSPRQDYQGPLLPSPHSTNFSNAHHLPPILSPATSVQSSVHITHLQDLQHQVSIKTIALSTLQREYDNLLQRLQRQQVKSQTLEKKFEVSDLEINSLTDERERLAMQVTALEEQVAVLVRARDDARKEVVENTAQYLQIVEMAGKLQAREALEIKRKNEEIQALQARLQTIVEGQTGRARDGGNTPSNSTSSYRPKPPKPSGEIFSAKKALTTPQLSCELHTTPINDITTPAPPNPSPSIRAATAREYISEVQAVTGNSASCPLESPHPSDEADPLRLRRHIRALEAQITAMAEESRSMRSMAIGLAQSGQRIVGLAEGALALDITPGGGVEASQQQDGESDAERQMQSLKRRRMDDSLTCRDVDH